MKATFTKALASVSIASFGVFPAAAAPIYLQCNSADGKHDAQIVLYESIGELAYTTSLTTEFQRVPAFFFPEAISWTNGATNDASKMWFHLDRTEPAFSITRLGSQPQISMSCGVLKKSLVSVF